MTTEVVSVELKAVLRRLKLSGLLPMLPDRLALSRQQKTSAVTQNRPTVVT